MEPKRDIVKEAIARIEADPKTTIAIKNLESRIAKLHEQIDSAGIDVPVKSDSGNAILGGLSTANSVFFDLGRKLEESREELEIESAREWAKKTKRYIESLEAEGLCLATGDQSETESETPKKITKKTETSRALWNSEAAGALRKWIEMLSDNPKTKQKDAIEEYIDRNKHLGIKSSTMEKRFQHNPDQWKPQVAKAKQKRNTKRN